MNKTKFSNFLLNILFPCFVLSGIVGVISGTVVFFFKYVAHLLTNESIDIYFFVQSINLHIYTFMFISPILPNSMRFPNDKQHSYYKNSKKP